MQRRDFLRNTAILGAVMATPSTVLGEGKAMGNKRVFDVTLNHEILEAGKKTRLWIPLPFIREYQSVSDIKFGLIKFAFASSAFLRKKQPFEVVFYFVVKGVGA